MTYCIICVITLIRERDWLFHGSDLWPVGVSEGEQEEQWLADAGLSNLISEDSEDVDKAVLLSTLTRTQAEAVQRRLDSYTLSLRKRNKPAPRDVRDIFNSPITQVSSASQTRLLSLLHWKLSSGVFMVDTADILAINIKLIIILGRMVDAVKATTHTVSESLLLETHIFLLPARTQKQPVSGCCVLFHADRLTCNNEGK